MMKYFKFAVPLLALLAAPPVVAEETFELITNLSGSPPTPEDGIFLCNTMMAELGAHECILDQERRALRGRDLQLTGVWITGTIDSCNRCSGGRKLSDLADLAQGICNDLVASSLPHFAGLVPEECSLVLVPDGGRALGAAEEHVGAK